MRDMVVPHALDKPLFDGRLAYDVFELHDIYFGEQKYSFLGIVPEKRINKFNHNFTCKMIAMFLYVFGEKQV